MKLNAVENTLFRGIFYILFVPVGAELLLSQIYQMHPLSCVCTNRKTQTKQNPKAKNQPTNQNIRVGVLALILTETTLKFPPNSIITTCNYSAIASPGDWRWNFLCLCGVMSYTRFFFFFPPRSNDRWQTNEG